MNKKELNTLAALAGILAIALLWQDARKKQAKRNTNAEHHRWHI